VSTLYRRVSQTYLHSFRAHESDVQQLFEWASSGHERTVNQRVRPGLIIIINKLPSKASTKWLDVQLATDTLLSHLELSDTFSELRSKWSERGKEVKTAVDLINCYYDSYRVVCVPELGNGDVKSTRLISQQYKALYGEIRSASRRLRQKKMEVGMNLDSESFNTYVEHAFHKLSKNLNSCIDFYYLASKDQKVPSRISEHLTSLIVKLLEKENYSTSNEIGQETDLLDRLAPYLAWCIATQLRLGSAPYGE
jgi:hypothetical protein